jgi:hypothetical protein
MQTIEVEEKNNHQSKSKKIAAKKRAEVWWQLPVDDGNAAMVMEMVMAAAAAAAVAAKAKALGNGWDEVNAIVDDAAMAEVWAMAAPMAAVMAVG